MKKLIIGSLVAVGLVVSVGAMAAESPTISFTNANLPAPTNVLHNVVGISVMSQNLNQTCDFTSNTGFIQVTASSESIDCSAKQVAAVFADSNAQAEGQVYLVGGNKLPDDATLGCGDQKLASSMNFELTSYNDPTPHSAQAITCSYQG